MITTTHHESSDGNLSITGQHNPDDEKSKIVIKFSFESNKTGRTYSAELWDADIESLHPFFINNTSLITEFTGDIPSVIEHDIVFLFYEFKIKSQIHPWKIKLSPENTSPTDNEIRMLKKKIASLEETIAESATEISNLNEVVKKNTAAIDYLLGVSEHIIKKNSQITISHISDHENVYDNIYIMDKSFPELLDHGVKSDNMYYQKNPIVFCCVDYIMAGGNPSMDLVLRVINNQGNKEVHSVEGKTFIEHINECITKKEIEYPEECQRMAHARASGWQSSIPGQIANLKRVLEEARRLGFK